MLEMLRNIALNALNTVQKINAMSKILKIDKVLIRGVRLCILKHVGDVGDRSSTPKGCNAIYVRDIGDHNNLQYTQCLMVCLKSPKSQLSKTFFGLKIH